MEKERLDILVQRRFGVSRSKAQGLIQTGMVLGAEGAPLTKAGERVSIDTALHLREQPRFVSRGGEKLAAAMEAWSPPVAGRVALDVGASTGGFTDCLLQYGAAKVYAVDVGYGQLAWKLRDDPRVVPVERTNVRNLMPEHLDERPTFFTADCSFISLRLVLPAIVRVMAASPEGIVLIKPQFEAGRASVGRGGVVRDPAVRAAAVQRICNEAGALGFRKIDVIPSPLAGPAGNMEFLAYLRDFHPPAPEAGE
jgi:23S rRNA (cytidine1920-2'-O)/16S rRNA (cytidine1409-2'-O)-methyltransferase